MVQAIGINTPGTIAFIAFILSIFGFGQQNDVGKKYS